MTVISTLPDISGQPSFVVASGSHLYVLDRSRCLGTILSADEGVLSLVGTFRLPNCHKMSGAIIDDETLLITTDHRLITFSLADPEAPVFASTTTYAQKLNAVVAIEPGSYWLATEETIADQEQEFQLPTTAGNIVGGTLVMLSAASGTAENTDTPFDSGGGEVPLNTVETPVITPDSGDVLLGATITITVATPGASIYYTTDGSTPDAGDTLYTGAFAVPGTTSTTVKAIGILTGYIDSGVASETYTFGAVATPTISPASGEVLLGASITISTVTSGATIYYTTDGSTPTVASTVYSGAFTIPGPGATTVKAFATKTGLVNSGVATNSYTFAVTATPVISPASGAQVGVITVTITCSTPSSTIYYTVDGSTPTTGSTVYSGGFPESANVTVKALATSTGRINSGVATNTYTFSADGLRVFTSDATVNPFTADGTTWSNQTTVGFTSRAPGAGRSSTTGTVIVGGTNGNIARTTDGLTWSILSPAGMAGNTHIRWGNGVWVGWSAAAPFTSADDGLTWTPGAALTGTATNLEFVNGLFLAGNTSGTVFYSSPDGVTWTSRTMPAAATFGDSAFFNTRYFVGTIIATVDGNLYSNTALTGAWTTVSFPTIGTGSMFIRVVRAVNGLLFVIGSHSSGLKVYSSTDGVTFTALTMPAAFLSAAANSASGIEYFAGNWWICGNGGAFAKSADGATWTDVSGAGQAGNEVRVLFYRQ